MCLLCTVNSKLRDPDSTTVCLFFIAGDSTDLGLSDCLAFFTGAEQIPLVGFDV